jgi:hypothetical protein
MGEHYLFWLYTTFDDPNPLKIHLKISMIHPLGVGEGSNFKTLPFNQGSSPSSKLKTWQKFPSVLGKHVIKFGGYQKDIHHV